MTATVTALRMGDRDAVAIGKLYEKAKGSVIDQANNLIEAGQKLTDKKALKGRGGWLPWLKENADTLGFGKRTAQLLMKVAKDNTQSTSHLTEAKASQIVKTVWNASRRKKPRKTDPHKDTIAALHDRGTPATKIADELGIDSDRDVRREIERQEIRLEVLNELDVDPETLTPSAKGKLEIAKRKMERSLAAEHAARMRNVDEEVRQRVVAENKDYLAMVKEQEAKVRQDEKLWREIINGHKPLFTVDQFKTILMCLHPDGERTPEKLAEAFRLFNNKKLQLTGAKQ